MAISDWMEELILAEKDGSDAVTAVNKKRATMTLALESKAAVGPTGSLAVNNKQLWSRRQPCKAEIQNN